MFKSIFFLILMQFVFVNLEAQETVAELNELSLEQLLDLEVSVATKKPQKMSEAPAIVKVITREEIESMGARS
jgi:outer membrane receptor for ferrienterochelin and colicin